MGVIEFKRPEVVDPHMSGVAICAACRHEHIAVVQVGVALSECPNCHAHKARMKYDCVPADDSIWQCGCGCDLFRISERGAICINCGVRQLF